VGQGKLGGKNLSFPILHIIGLPGAGKTTLAEKLSKKYNLPIFKIGEYRSKFPLSPIGETNAWVALFQDLSRRKWRNCILETTGLNRRESFLRTTLPFAQMVTIKLEAPKRVLYKRIAEKSKREQGGGWSFSVEYPDKVEFVKKLYMEFKRLPAEIRIDTTKLGINKVCMVAINELHAQMILYSKFNG
jgi:thymidylate kinase